MGSLKFNKFRNTFYWILKICCNIILSAHSSNRLIDQIDKNNTSKVLINVIFANFLFSFSGFSNG